MNNKVKEKLDKKAQNILNKYNKKIQVIEENCKLTDEEKYNTYKSLLKKVKRQLANNEISGNFKNMAYEINDMFVIDEPLVKLFIGAVSTLFLVFGGILLGASAKMNSPFATSLGAILTSIPIGATLHALLNAQINGNESLMEDLSTRSQYININSRFALESIEKNLENKVNTYEQRTEMVGNI